MTSIDRIILLKIWGPSSNYEKNRNFYINLMDHTNSIWHVHTCNTVQYIIFYFPIMFCNLSHTDRGFKILSFPPYCQE